MRQRMPPCSPTSSTSCAAPPSPAPGTRRRWPGNSARASSGCCDICRRTCRGPRSPTSCPSRRTQLAPICAGSTTSSAPTTAPRRSGEPANCGSSGGGRTPSTSRRSPFGTGRDGGRLRLGGGRRAGRGQRPGTEQDAGDDGAGGEDAGGPPERGVVAVRERERGQGRAADQPGRGQVRGEVGGDRAGEQGVQQRGADRGAELLADRDGGGRDAGILRCHAERAGADRRGDHHAHAEGGQDERADHARPYPVCGPSWASQTAAPAAVSIPQATSGLGPTRGIRTMVARLEAAAEPALNGRNATPVTSGEYPSVCCR